MAANNISPGEPVILTVDGGPLAAYRGQTIAAALYASGRRVFRATRVNGKPRGLYCAMGVCYDCLVQADGETVRACVTPVENGMQVTLPGGVASGEGTR